MGLLTTNKKLDQDSIWSFNLPCIKTCPGASACKKFCYCKKENRYPSVTKSRENKYLLSLEKSFIDLFSAELIKNKKKIKAIRLHASGDFYNQEYLDKVFLLAARHSDIDFYCYTKSLHLDFSDRPANFYVIGSEGGLYDEHLDQLKQVGLIDSICRIIDKNVSTLEGWINVSKSDKLALHAAKNKLNVCINKH